MKSYSYFEQSSLTQKHLQSISDLFFNYVRLLFKEDELIFNKDNFFRVEFKKSIIRGLIRYNHVSSDFLSSIKSDFSRIKNLDKESISIDNLYLLFHLSNDLSEEGTYHVDSRIQTFTLWSPLIDYDYPSINFFWPGYNFFKILKFFRLNIFRKFFIKTLQNPKKNNTYFWDGRIPHKGRLNSSKKFSAAITSNVVLKDSSYNFYGTKLCTYENIDNNEIITDFEKLFIFLESNVLIIKTSEKKFNECINNLKKIDNFQLNIKNLKIFSFALSLLAQRTNAIIDNELNTKISNLIDLLALRLNTENLSSRERVSKSKFISDEDKQKFIKYFDK